MLEENKYSDSSDEELKVAFGIEKERGEISNQLKSQLSNLYGTTLKIEGINLHEIDAIYIADIIRCRQFLDISIINCGLKDRSANHIFSAIFSYDHHLSWLDFSNNKISQIGGISQFFAKGGKIDCLEMEGNIFNYETATELYDNFVKGSIINMLNFHFGSNKYEYLDNARTPKYQECDKHIKAIEPAKQLVAARLVTSENKLFSISNRT